MLHVLLTGSACKNRWFNLRDQCRRAIKNKRTSSRAAVKNKKWKFEDEMAFLNPYFQERETLTNIHDTNENNNGSETVELEQAEWVNNGNEVEEQVKPEERLRVSNTTTFRASSKAKEEPKGSSDITSSLLMKYILEKNHHISEPKDTVDLFFSSIAATVKTFTPYYQNIAKSRIFATVSELEMEQIMKNHQRSGSSSPPSHEGRGQLNVSVLDLQQRPSASPENHILHSLVPSGPSKRSPSSCSKP
jgi:hypothetical protein